MKRKIKKYIQEWEMVCYSNGIPDQAPVRLEELNKVPSYRKIAIAILKNDYSLKTLGFYPEYSKFYDELKKIELSNKGKINKQLKLNL